MHGGIISVTGDKRIVQRRDGQAHYSCAMCQTKERIAVVRAQCVKRGDGQPLFVRNVSNEGSDWQLFVRNVSNEGTDSHCSCAMCQTRIRTGNCSCAMCQTRGRIAIVRAQCVKRGGRTGNCSKKGLTPLSFYSAIRPILVFP